MEQYTIGFCLYEDKKYLVADLPNGRIIWNRLLCKIKFVNKYFTNLKIIRLRTVITHIGLGQDWPPAKMEEKMILPSMITNSL